jgi:hypothetical protein
MLRRLSSVAVCYCLAALLLLLDLGSAARQQRGHQQHAAWSQCSGVDAPAALATFLAQHDGAPQLNKAIFFSKLGKSNLCDKLAAAHVGRLDFAVAGKDSDLAGVADRLL